MLAQGVDEKICEEFNRVVGLNDGTPPGLKADLISADPFDGTFSDGTMGANVISEHGRNSPELFCTASKTGCYLHGTSYEIYYVLVAR